MSTTTITPADAAAYLRAVEVPRTDPRWAVAQYRRGITTWSEYQSLVPGATFESFDADWQSLVDEVTVWLES